MPALAHDAAHEPHGPPRTRRVDILQREADCSRITPAAFQAGVWLRSVYACGVVPDSPDARITQVRNVIGESGEQLLRDILDGRSYPEVAAQRDRLTGDVTFVAKSFRYSLECVAEMRRHPRALPRRI